MRMIRVSLVTIGVVVMAIASTLAAVAGSLQTIAWASHAFGELPVYLGYSQDKAEKSIRRLVTDRRKLRLDDAAVRLRRDSLAA
jgi:hypothetical protein